MSGAVPGRGDDHLLGYRVRHADQPLFEAMCEVAKLMPQIAPSFAAEFDACLQLPVCGFRGSFPILRRFTETMFAIDGDAAAALARLKAARRYLHEARSPHEAIDGLADFAIAFGKIGFRDQAREALHEMREMSLGTYLAAKKDGQYQLWAAVLTAANEHDPDRAELRSFTMLRLVAGVDDSEAHDQAWRIAKIVLVEAMASGAMPAWDAFRMGAFVGRMALERARRRGDKGHLATTAGPRPTACRYVDCAQPPLL